MSNDGQGEDVGSVQQRVLNNDTKILLISLLAQRSL